MKNKVIKSIIQLISSIMLCATMGVAIAHAGCAKIKPTKPGEVYLLRGLANIFSLGLDKTGKQFSKSGIENCIFNHSHWRALVDDIVERGRNKQISFPIVIIGHSLGANVAPQMATLIGKFNIPVSYVVMLDPVETTVVGKNVRDITNYYLPKRKDNKLYASADFKGNLQNIDVSSKTGMGHFNIDENKKLRAIIVDAALKISEIAEKK